MNKTLCTLVVALAVGCGGKPESATVGKQPVQAAEEESVYLPLRYRKLITESKDEVTAALKRMALSEKDLSPFKLAYLKDKNLQLFKIGDGGNSCQVVIDASDLMQALGISAKAEVTLLKFLHVPAYRRPFGVGFDIRLDDYSSSKAVYNASDKLSRSLGAPSYIDLADTLMESSEVRWENVSLTGVGVADIELKGSGAMMRYHISITPGHH